MWLSNVPLCPYPQADVYGENESKHHLKYLRVPVTMFSALAWTDFSLAHSGKDKLPTPGYV